MKSYLNHAAHTPVSVIRKLIADRSVIVHDSFDLSAGHRKAAKMAVAEASDRQRWKKTGVRSLIRKSGLSQEAVYAIIEGELVRRSTLATFRSAIDD